MDKFAGCRLQIEVAIDGCLDEICTTPKIEDGIMGVKAAIGRAIEPFVAAGLKNEIIDYFFSDWLREEIEALIEEDSTHRADRESSCN